MYFTKRSKFYKFISLGSSGVYMETSKYFIQANPQSSYFLSEWQCKVLYSFSGYFFRNIYATEIVCEYSSHSNSSVKLYMGNIIHK
jgi:hypothetical protein